MEFDKEYTRMVLEVTLDHHYEGLVLRGETSVYKPAFEDWLKTEIENYPEGFNCFFETSWDELTTEERSERKELILSIV